MGSCEIRTLHPGVNANTSVVSALSAGGQIFGATETGDGGSLAVFSMGLLPMGTPVPYVGALRDLDGRFGRAIAVTDREVFLFNGTSWSVLPNPPELVSCFAGATYNAGAGIEHVAVCDTDGGLRAYSVTVASGFGASVSVPTTVTGLSEVRVRPDGAGLFGRYLLRGSSSAWDFRTFQQSQTNVVGSTGFNAQHAFLATSNDQTCVAAVEESPGIRVWRPSAQPNSFNYPSSIPYAVEGTTNTNLRGLVTVGSGIDVYVLERSGAATPLRMRGFELPAELNEWLLVVDRPGRIIEYRLGAGIRRVVATALSEAELLVAVRCTTQTGTSLCQATPGTYVVRLPLE